MFQAEDRFIRVNLYTSFVALTVGALFGLLQALARAPFIKLQIPAPLNYYQILTAHGVLMALVFTTFFIIGLATFAVVRSLGVSFHSVRLAWTAYFFAALGTVIAAAFILAGKATVLYTFYAPLQAHPAFYIGATLLIVGTWVYALEIFMTYHRWRAGNPKERIPLMAHGVLATLILWLIATIGVAVLVLFLLLPWSLGIIPRVDPVMARDLFWYFGHPLVYFWLLPTAIVWYAVLPRLAGGKLYSDTLGRLAFVLLLVLSTPVGFHHELADPGVSIQWKYIHTLLTFSVAIPSMITAFTIPASLELGGRARGGRGLLGWIGKLPWGEPAFAAIALSVVFFGFGGIGGIINASFNLNSVVHNTSWIVGHFHITVGTAVALTFMGTSYWLLPVLTGKPLRWSKLALGQVYLWAIGMVIMSLALHLAGLLGSPRRTSDVTYFGSEVAASWAPHVNVAAIGAVFLAVSVVLFLVAVWSTITSSARTSAPIPIAEALSGPDASPRVLDRWPLWTALAVVLVLIGYAVPLYQQLQMPVYGSPGFSPF